jgi:hypothetical protein
MDDPAGNPGVGLNVDTAGINHGLHGLTQIRASEPEFGVISGRRVAVCGCNINIRDLALLASSVLFMSPIIDELVRRIAADPLCKLLPVSDKPWLNSSIDALPSDLDYFYSLCGGAELFLSRDFGFRVVPPDELFPATPIIKAFDYQSMKGAFDTDISFNWHLLFRSTGPEENIVIDLHPDRRGICYDGYVSTYASSDCKIVARSFAEALGGALDAQGERLFWEGRDPLGYVYEELGVEPPCG